MGILTRYLLRAHLGPFFFAFSLLTGLVFINTIAQRVGRLVGKGLPTDVIAEFVLLALPHTVALTFPMAVLVAVLYAFSSLASSNEITAMSAGGVKPTRLLIPIAVAGAVLTLVMLVFNDRILPEANHRLRNLGVDISQKSPTFQLRERVVNNVETDGQGTYFLKADQIDPTTNEMRNVVIYDVSTPTLYRTTYADSGTMMMNAARTDLVLTLNDGRVLEVSDTEDGSFKITRFGTQTYVLEGVADVLERSGGGQRGDREMSIGMLSDAAESRRVEVASVREGSRARAEATVRRALGYPAEGDSAKPAGPNRPPVRRIADVLPPDGLTQSTAINARTNAARVQALTRQVNQYSVEIHKKFTISFACIVFVLIGAPLAIRFPRGGVGMVITISVAVFGLYWIGLIGGEKLADDGVVDPFWIMWAPNLVFLVSGVFMVRRMGRWVATARGGGWADLRATLAGALTWPVRRLRRAGA